jgi:protein subunit release factor A
METYVPRVEILSGAGGAEADQWVADLSDIVGQYARQMGWVVEEADRIPGTVGGFRRVIINVYGSEAYARLRWIQGTHRVQRIGSDPKGRVHTSTATVNVVPIGAAEERLRSQRDVASEPVERIRTYNYPQDRVTDHRVGVTFKNLDRLADVHLDYLAGILDAISGLDRSS